MNTANIRNWLLNVTLLCCVLSACGKKPEPVPPPAPPKAEAGSKNSTAAERPPEPTEAEIRDLVATSVEEINRQGGMVLVVTATGKQSAPIMVRLDGYVKSECIPYTKAFRCDGNVSLSYPGSDFPAETLRHSRRFQKDAQGRWTMD